MVFGRVRWGGLGSGGKIKKYTKIVVLTSEHHCDK